MHVATNRNFTQFFSVFKIIINCFIVENRSQWRHERLEYINITLFKPNRSIGHVSGPRPICTILTVDPNPSEIVIMEIG